MAVYQDGSAELSSLHERVSRAEIAKRLAALMSFEFGGEYDPARRYGGPVYFVPNRTLVGLETASDLGIRGEQDLFGGVVPHAFVATKAITHPLVTPDANAPPGWKQAFGDAVHSVVLAGFTVFTQEDAVRATEQLLRRGGVRLKPVLATGGRGQVPLSDLAALEAALGAVDPGELSRSGLVLEENLTSTTTYSIGQVQACDLLVSYYGTQRLTPDNGGLEVYGGSDLVVVRGGFEALLALAMPEAARIAVQQARAYDAAASAQFPGLLASRRNYDVVQGLDAQGRWRSGVLEQSWRLGGASAAEIAALEAFHADPGLQVVRASCVERYGDAAAPPADAIILFRGVDDAVGAISKHAKVEPYDPG
ncbi:DUF3182 family protein [Methylobacterium nodulans]|uniref:DUF3182 family protein n=1 Tax=Methylobacterium nodulans TaxID=114616 RepID=UPI001FCCBBF8|nr:DUF3182 family protein [Methylobacterium nodulans]